MAQPSLNDGEIHARLEQMHGGLVAESVGAYTLAREARALRCDRRDAGSQNVANAEAGKGSAAGVHKQMGFFLCLNTTLFEMVE